MKRLIAMRMTKENTALLKAVLDKVSGMSDEERMGTFGYASADEVGKHFSFNELRSILNI